MTGEQRMLGGDELAERIKRGGRFFIAADNALLERLPKGDWIGGTIPYFMTGQGGMRTADKAYALELPDYITGCDIKTYDVNSIADVYKDSPENGFSLLIIPASGGTHLSFALNAPGYENFATSPLVGWIAGGTVPDTGGPRPMVMDGRFGMSFYDAAVVMHVSLPKGKTAVIGIINIFEPSDGDVLTFRETGFSAAEVLVNGKPRNFAEYIAEKALDTKLPLVANYGGAMINVSFRTVDAATGKVEFFAPLFKDVEYRHAKPVGDYLRAFMDQKPPGIDEKVMFSCNCILNYLYAGLEGKTTTGFTGPITFGEIAYQLLNQTAVYLEIVTANLAERLRTETAMRRSQRLLTTLMDTMPDPVFHKDADGRLRGCNKAYEELAGLPKDKILGRTVREIFPREIAEVFSAKNDGLLAHGGQLTYELALTAANGKARHAVVHTATFTAAGGGVGGLVGVINDVTELRRTSDELKLFRDLIESSTDAVMITLPEDGRFIDVNESACEQFGYSRQELLKMKVSDIRTGLEHDADWQELVASIKSRPFLLEEVPHRRKNGEAFPAEINVKYVVLNGKDYLVAILRDISERKKMEAAMKEVQTLQGLIPICASCKKVRNDKGYWERVETYISQRSTAKFSHGLCEDCIKKLYGNEKWFKDKDKDQ